MKEFKQWHEEDFSRFHSETEVIFSQCNRNKFLSLQELLKITSDLAGQDYTQRGFSHDFLLERNFVFLVSRISFRFHKRPVENQEIVIQTWEEKSEVFQFIRAFEVCDRYSGEKLISGLTTWLLVNPSTRRIIPAKKFDLRPEIEFTSEHDCMFPEKIVMPENMELIAERKILYSDIDANGHTNNARYAAFIMDSLPQEYQDLYFTDFRLNYAKEALFNQNLKIYANFDKENKKISIVGKIEEQNSEGSVVENTSFDAELYY